MSSLFEVKNINFVVTGGLGQIGLKLSEYLEQNGSKVVIIDIFDQKKLKILKKKYLFLNSKNIKILSVDISKKEKIKNSLSKILNFVKNINVLVNLAAIDANNKGNFNKNFNFHNFPYDLLKKSIDINLLGTLNISQIFCEYFIKKKIAGNIINVASIYSIVAPNIALYNKKSSSKNQRNKPIDYVISKSSIPNLTKYIATNYGRQKIRSNCLVPHGIKNLHKKDFIKKYSNLSPMGRMSDVKEVIGPIIFLSTKASSYMTGATLIIDGGWTAW
jgi:NAD(P)-dependent dehydrogenase (short-subunit alcohol dehydrogenase family)|tara:strand:+ start:185 stop:1006 length:822 start_codon:yes stop_codon:yes gene_type:complete